LRYIRHVYCYFLLFGNHHCCDKKTKGRPLPDISHTYLNLRDKTPQVDLNQILALAPVV